MDDEMTKAERDAQSGRPVRMNPRYLMPWAERRAHGDVNKAVRMVMGDHIAIRRTKEETGMSLAQIIERLAGESIAENCRQTGCCPATIKKYRERWGI